MKRQNIQMLVAQIIETRRAQLKKEIAEWEDRMRGTEEYWGLGGPYMRQEKACERRKKELADLEDYARQVGRYTPHKEVQMYGLYCRNCRNVILTKKAPGGDWSECPCCRQMIYDNSPIIKTFKIEDEGQYWLQAFEKETDDE